MLTKTKPGRKGVLTEQACSYNRKGKRNRLVLITEKEKGVLTEQAYSYNRKLTNLGICGHHLQKKGLAPKDLLLPLAESVPPVSWVTSRPGVGDTASRFLSRGLRVS